MASADTNPPGAALPSGRWSRLRIAPQLALLRSRSTVVAAAALAGFAVAAAALLWGGHDKPVIEIDADFGTTACCSWQVWVNGTSAADVNVLPIRQGRSTYRIPLFASRVGRLRMPLADQVPGSVRIYGIRLRRGSTLVNEISPAQLRAGTPIEATSRLSGGVLAVSPTAAHPFLDLPVALDPHESRLRLALAKLDSQPLRTYTSFLAAAALACAIASGIRRSRRLFLCALVATLGLVAALPWLSHRIALRDSVTHAVGFASYTGVWKTRERFVLDASVLIAVAVPALLLAAGAYRRRRAAAAGAAVPGELVTAVDDLAAGEQPRRRRRLVGVVAIIVPVLLVALAAVPNLRLYIGGTPQYQPNWDGNNFIFWMYLIQRQHLEPIKDFFWVYGFQWLGDLRVPWGQLLSYILFLSWWVLLAIGTYFALARFYAGRGLMLRYGLLTAFWVVPVVSGLTSFAMRYVAALAVLMLFMSIDGRDPLLSPKRIGFVLSFAWLGLFEVAQAGYAGVPIVMLLGVEAYVCFKRGGVRGVRLPLVGGLGALVLALAIDTVVLASLGIFSKTLSFYGQLLTASSAYAYPGSIDVWVTRPTLLSSYVFWAVPVLVLFGTYGVLTAARDEKPLSAGVLALGLLALMIDQKQVLRPDISDQIWFAVLFGLAWWAVAERPAAALPRWVLGACAAGAMAATVIVTGQVGTAWSAVSDGPQRVSASIVALAHDEAAFRSTARLAFAPAAFDRFVQYEGVVAALRRDADVRRGAPVWILGDDSPITMMLDHGWPYYFNDIYDSSPIAFQKEIISRLRRHPPARVVWNFSPDALVYDNVPDVVRTPLLYDWAIRNVVPDEVVGPFAVLRPRRAGERIPLAWWRKRLGSTFDLGHVPAVADLPSGRCRDGRGDCGSYVVADAPTGAPTPPSVTIPLRVDGLPFQLTFATTPGVRHYVVPLDRVWFWSAGTARDASSLQSGTASGVQVRLVRRPLDPNTLY